MVDYIVVGAGSAGCVLASRLSESPENQVLLLEAGAPDRDPRLHIPAAYSTVFKSKLDWSYETEAQPHMNNRRLYWPRGRVLGGSSTINAMIYIRGHDSDYDLWQELGAEGWGWQDVLPYYRRMENQERGGSSRFGSGGPLNIADQRSPNVMTLAFIEAAKQAGIVENPDFNAPVQDGVGLYQVTQKGGRRHSTAQAYLKPALKRPNLRVITGAVVTRILFEGKRAAGVEYLRNGQREMVRASREVILSGGAINSPQVLLLSGIGPADHLQSLGIDLVHDLPGVGENLQDHIAVGLFFYASQPVSLASAQSPMNLLRYLLFRRGPLTSNVGEGGMFVRTDPALPKPDLQYFFGPIHYLDHGLTRLDGHGFALGCVLLNPESRGHIRLKSADPQAAPAIQPYYLESEADLETMVKGVKFAREVAYQAALAPFRGDEIRPGRQMNGDDAWRAYIRDNGETLYHPVGTCKMGSDAMAVVDPQLKVKGVEGLRVVDASVMPTVISGNTNAPTIMIAEKAADHILGK